MKKIHHFPLFFTGFFITRVLGQTMCDTIILQDGRRIAADIVRSDKQGILYRECSVEAERQYFIAKEKVAGVKANIARRPTVNPPPRLENHLLPPQRSRVRATVEPGKPKTIIWAGLSLSNVFLFAFDAPGKSIYQLGAEIGFRRTPMRLGIVVRPIFLEAPNGYFQDFQKSGVNGELGLVLKKFSRGRLTGNVSRFYWGLDVRTGRQAYRYTCAYRPSTINQITYKWITILTRVGYQWTCKMFAFDLALPIGYQRYHYRRTGDAYSDSKAATLALQPSVSVGWRF